ncbi:DNA polymerase beta superfamily protein [Clostridium perfringens]|uniref:DNA polymerase beta superfamily protein n=1 Tax=Clostridium perfringens TaxID=1502 RepID=UPI00189A7CF4|nr:nucleotidyltransferase domain-containing protein [Clostridium perfringens]
MEFEGRKKLFSAIIGSCNYNLNVKSSDKDYKVFVIPTFDDLYFGKKFKKFYAGDLEDLDCHDMRKISDLLWKSNPNFIEVLYSKDLRINNNLSNETKDILRNIFKNRDEFAKMNLPYLYKACISIYLESVKTLDVGTKHTKYLIDKYGYNTKQAMYSIRILDFLRRFANSNFNDFEFAIRYDDNDDFRELLLDIRNGLYSKAQYTNIATNLLNEIERDFKDIYLNQTPNEKANISLINMIKRIIKIEAIEVDNGKE